MDQFYGDGLGKWEANRAFADLVERKVVLKRRDHAICGGIERVVFFPACEKDQAVAMQFLGGNLVGNHFLGFGHSPADGAAHPLECFLHRFGLRGDILIHRLEIGLGHWVRQ